MAILADETMRGFAGLRIALVGPLPPPAGGMANQTRQLAALLRGEGAEVELVQTNAPHRPAFVAQVPGVRALFRLLPYLWALWRAAGRNQLLHVMANSGWSWHLFAAPAIWIGRMRQRPVLVNYRGGEADAFLTSSGALVRRSMAHCQALLVPSGFLEAVFARHGMRAERLANVIDLARFRPSEATPVAAGPHLLVARNLEPLYDNATAIRALARVRERYLDAQLTIAGSGPELERLRDLTAQLGLAEAVHFAGRLEPEQMAALYRSSTLSINPSLADNMPNSVLESLASGVPVVSTNVGGVPYLLSHEQTGLLVPPADEQAMAAALLRLLDDGDLYRQLRARGLAEVQRYTWAQVGPRLCSHYLQALQPSCSTANLRPH